MSFGLYEINDASNKTQPRVNTKNQMSWRLAQPLVAAFALSWSLSE
ncbi:hypothetical protein MGWOODY_Tha249 [hydrothermal vent metagenome]|uniref:Uncharacterized protein n=1 Tax=hydrothermal vent metagenome TaxID=652676 RepID=A0A160T7Y4_9ZZZZ